MWTPELVRLLSGLPQAEDLRVSLYGPTPSHLEGVAALARTLAGGRPAVRVIRELGPALDGADVVLNQARIGGLHARRDDEALPVRLGAIGDESLGLGGLRAATRAVPFVHGAARELLRFSPTAWVLNLANPSDLLSRVWSEAGCSNVISLCDHADNYAAQIVAESGDPLSAEPLRYMGMAHLGWLVPHPGRDLRGLLHARPPVAPWLSEWGAIPTEWRIRLSDPLPVLQQQAVDPGARARHLQDLVQRLRTAVCAQDARGYVGLLRERSPAWYSVAAVPVIRALLGGEPARLTVGMPNGSRMAGMDPSVWLETRSVVARSVVHPEPIPNNGLCRADVEGIGKMRAMAYAAAARPSHETLAAYVECDPLCRPALEAPEWQSVLGLGRGSIDAAHGGS